MHTSSLLYSFAGLKLKGSECFSPLASSEHKLALTIFAEVKLHQVYSPTVKTLSDDIGVAWMQLPPWPIQDNKHELAH